MPLQDIGVSSVMSSAAEIAGTALCLFPQVLSSVSHLLKIIPHSCFFFFFAFVGGGDNLLVSSTEWKVAAGVSGKITR